MRRARYFFAFGTALLLLSAPAAMAMSFGRTTTASTLGQRLDFIAQLAFDVDETVGRECIGARVMAGDNRVNPENVRVTLESAGEPGIRAIRVTTRTTVDEPVVTIDVTVGCRSQMSRRFVAFIDPPALGLASADAEKSLPRQRVDEQVASPVEVVTRAAAPRARGRAAQVAGGKSVRRHTPGARETSVARAAPRLRLEAAPVVAAARAPLLIGSRQAAAKADAATDASLASAAAALEAASAALTQERARFQELEAGLAKVRVDSLAQQKTIGALQVRLRQAEGDRYLNGLVYALAAAVLFFALLATAFWALRPRQRRRARWFDAQANQHKRAVAAGASSAHGPAPATPAPAISQYPSQWPESAHAILPVTTPATIGGLEVTTVLAPPSHYVRMAESGVPANAAAAGGQRSAAPSMEELIDLEQQAEFYVALGQDEAAIALLTAHLSAIGATSPLPFLQLLEIHQRRGDRASYEALREDFQDHFDALAPEWSSDLHFGRSLEAYPQTIARVQALWPTPLHAMRTLDGLLFRRDESDEAFDFPAYRELLFLYSIARELAGQVETDFGTIDLFLPLEDAAEGSARHDGPAAIDLDVSGWPDESRPEGLTIRRVAGRRGAG